MNSNILPIAEPSQSEIYQNSEVIDDEAKAKILAMMAKSGISTNSDPGPAEVSPLATDYQSLQSDLRPTIPIDPMFKSEPIIEFSTDPVNGKKTIVDESAIQILTVAVISPDKPGLAVELLKVLSYVQSDESIFSPVIARDKVQGLENDLRNLAFDTLPVESSPENVNQADPDTTRGTFPYYLGAYIQELDGYQQALQKTEASFDAVKSSVLTMVLGEEAVANGSIVPNVMHVKHNSAECLAKIKESNSSLLGSLAKRYKLPESLELPLEAAEEDTETQKIELPEFPEAVTIQELIGIIGQRDPALQSAIVLKKYHEKNIETLRAKVVARARQITTTYKTAGVTVVDSDEKR